MNKLNIFKLIICFSNLKGHYLVGIIFVMVFVVIRIDVFMIIMKQLNNTNNKINIQENVNVIVTVIIIVVVVIVHIMEVVLIIIHHHHHRHHHHHQAVTHHHVIVNVLINSNQTTRINRKKEISFFSLYSSLIRNHRRGKKTQPKSFALFLLFLLKNIYVY